MKPFTRSSKAGFTLVELIIVIAILAILAGVAVPVYSGYIKKANQAADLQLLAAVNTSFAAACTEVGIGSTDVSGAVLKVTGGCITGVLVSGFRDGVTPIAARSDSYGFFAALSVRTLSTTDARARIGEAFQIYFGDNAATELKYYEGAGNFVFRNGVFEAFDNGADVEYSTSYGIIKVSTDDLNAYYNSEFAAIGTAELTENIANLSDTVLRNSAYWLSNNSGFQLFLEELLEGTNRNLSDLTDAEKANALVLYAASMSDSIDTEGLLSGNYSIDLDLEKTGEIIANASTMYGLMLAYANSEYGKQSTGVMVSEGGAPNVLEGLNGLPDGYSSWDEYLESIYPGRNVRVDEFDELIAMLTGHKYEIVETTSAEYQSVGDYFNASSEAMTNMQDLSDLYNAIASTDGWESYLLNQGENDINGFIAALNTVNSNIDAIDINQFLTDGYLDENFVAMLSAVLGN